MIVDFKVFTIWKIKTETKNIVANMKLIPYVHLHA